MTRAHDRARARRKTLPLRAVGAVHVVRVDPQRLVHAPHPHLPPLRRRRRRRRLAREAVQRLAAALVRTYVRTPGALLAPGPTQARSAASTGPTR